MLKQRAIYNLEHELFRETVRKFSAQKVAPYFAAWEAAGIVDREYWRAGGEAGLLCPQVPECYGGVGGDFRLNAIVIEELFYSGFTGAAANFSVHSDVCAGYLLKIGTEDQKANWLPKMISGEVVSAIAMTEPGTGSDLKSIRTKATKDGENYIISGQKTFISNGQHCDIVMVVCRTSERSGSHGMSLFLVETSRKGLRRGRNLEKLGAWCSDTSELFFDDVCVPAANRLGAEGGAMGILMAELPQERLAIAIQSAASAQKAFDITCAYVHQRSIFGKPVGSFQNTKFKLADLKADLAVGWAYVDQSLAQHVAGMLTNEAASIAKLWLTEMHGRVVDTCLQFFGGYGFMREYEICRLFADARVQRIYGGTSEVMRDLISRGL